MDGHLLFGRHHLFVKFNVRNRIIVDIYEIHLCAIFHKHLFFVKFEYTCNASQSDSMCLKENTIEDILKIYPCTILQTPTQEIRAVIVVVVVVVVVIRIITQHLSSSHSKCVNEKWWTSFKIYPLLAARVPSSFLS